MTSILGKQWLAFTETPGEHDDLFSVFVDRFGDALRFVEQMSSRINPVLQNSIPLMTTCFV